MTVSTPLRSVSYVGNGATTAFPFTFPVYEIDHLVVELYTPSTGIKLTLINGADFTVTGVGNNSTGGVVTYNPSGTPIPATKTLIISRTVPYVQPVDIRNQSGFYPDVIERQLDLMVMMTQQLEETSIEYIDVTDFVTQLDNTTDEGVGLKAAVDLALAQNKALFIQGIGYSSIDIPNLANIRMKGQGGIRINGGRIWWAEPRATANTSSTPQTLYISTGGSDGNSGVSPNFPLGTAAKAVSLMYNRGHVLEGWWEMNFAAGTYTPAQCECRINTLLSRNPILVNGPTIAANAAPLVIFDGTGSATGTGWRADNYVRMASYGVHFTNWATIGFDAYHYVVLTFRETWMTNNNWAHQAHFRSMIYHFSGKLENNTLGYQGFGHCGYSFGNPSDITNTLTVKGNDYGVRLNEFCSGHMDNVIAEDNVYAALFLQEGSRVTIYYGGEYRRNGAVVIKDSTSIISMDTRTNVQFYSDDPVDRNTRLFVCNGGDNFSAESDHLFGSTNTGFRWRSILKDYSVSGGSGATLVQTLVTKKVAAQMLAHRGVAMRAKLHGFHSTMNNNMYLRMKFGNATDGYATVGEILRPGTMPEGVFTMEFLLNYSDPTPNQPLYRGISEYTETDNAGGNVKIIKGSITTTAVESWRDNDFILEVERTNAGDTVTFINVEVEYNNG